MVYKQRGDTLVEVLMSLMVLTIVIVGAVTLMGRGLQAAQMALEHSETRQELNRQIEMLKFLRDQYAINPSGTDGVTWASIVTGSNGNPTDYSDCNVTAAKAGTAFYLTKPAATVVKNAFSSSVTPPSFATAGAGMWVEATPSNSVTPAYVDFVIRACWAGIGTSGQQQTVTAVRLYDPSR